MTMYERIKKGTTVTIRVQGGLRTDGTHEEVEVTGRAVMRGPAGWVIDTGGRHGTPQIATPENLVRVNARPAKK